jgi:hypothetical protein
VDLAQVNILDVAPDAGQMMGMSNTFATLPGIFGNILTGEARLHHRAALATQPRPLTEGAAVHRSSTEPAAGRLCLP